MASDPKLVERLRDVLGSHKGIEARRMFGGICFTLNGNMCVGVHNSSLMLRVSLDQAEALLEKRGVKPMDLTGKIMKGWVTVLPEAVRSKSNLEKFSLEAVRFVQTLPKKHKAAGP